MRLDVGDKLTYTPTAYAAGSNGTDAARERNERGKVHAVCVAVNHAHRWYRVEWKPDFDRPQHECFKF